MLSAVNLAECMNKKRGMCQCEFCLICGVGKHTAVHGPYTGKDGQQVDKPWGHPYIPPGLVFVVGEGHAFRGNSDEWQLPTGARSIRFYQEGKEVWVEFEGGVSFLLANVLEMNGFKRI